ncbi:AAA family ATPase [Acidithiobacillus sp. VAN18-1]|uniref:AAA family ATPase n=1 Tax=Igneacidithiobacillus copahuensis TaxID=2724909 RepID=A0AAE3CKA3_9PROT|nr:AAA family ATPase [Igneacidithiobacillus copahuensis]MBU2788677.1 AAA family ATPase [Igneacidithiobacillus copahuensis]MBU2796639.1 AAA family ATPase [Acidithiobacillus sp. VAN18-2]
MFLQTNEVRKMAIVNGLQLATIFSVWCAPRGSATTGEQQESADCKSAASKTAASKAPPEWGVQSVAEQTPGGGQTPAGGQPIGSQASNGFAQAQPDPIPSWQDHYRPVLTAEQQAAMDYLRTLTEETQGLLDGSRFGTDEQLALNALHIAQWHWPYSPMYALIRDRTPDMVARSMGWARVSADLGNPFASVFFAFLVSRYHRPEVWRPIVYGAFRLGLETLESVQLDQRDDVEKHFFLEWMAEIGFRGALQSAAMPAAAMQAAARREATPDGLDGEEFREDVRRFLRNWMPQVPSHLFSMAMEFHLLETRFDERSAEHPLQKVVVRRIEPAIDANQQTLINNRYGSLLHPLPLTPWPLAGGTPAGGTPAGGISPAGVRPLSGAAARNADPAGGRENGNASCDWVSDLKKEFPWMESLVDRLAGQWRLAQAVGEGRELPIHLRPVLLLGPAGLGKTRFLNRLGQVLGMPVVFLSLSGMADNMTLKGLSRGWAASRPGVLVDRFVDLRCANPLVILDEIDKAGTSTQNGRVWETLLTMLEPGTSHQVMDEFLLGPVDYSAVNWVATANGLEHVPGPLLTRFEIVRIEDPRPGDFPVILENLMGDIARQLGVESSALPDLDPRVVRKLEREFRENPGSLRKLRTLVTRLLEMESTGRMAERGGLQAGGPRVVDAQMNVLEIRKM